MAAQPLEAIHWETPVDSAPQYVNGSLLVHYGTPLVTADNTVIVPELDRTTFGYDLKAYDGVTGALKWTQLEGREFVHPPRSWIPSDSPTLAPFPGGPRLYFAGAGGTIMYRDAPDAAGSVTPGRIAFYGNAAYEADPAAFSGVRVSSPLISDSQGNVFFTYRVTGVNPLGLIGGLVRIGADGLSTYADIGLPALDSAPALSNDEATLYAVFDGFLARFDSTSLTRLAQIRVGTVSINASSSPTVGPDGDVYFGVTSPSVHGRGTLSHFSADLATSYTPGSFGWDTTVAIVPAGMVPSYVGTSTYLVMTKYNDYARGGGSGINKLALLDPRSTQIDEVTGSLAMTTVLSIASPTPDPEYPEYPGAVIEWCINSAAVDPATHSIFANNEDGNLYRWDTVTNTLAERIKLTSGVGAAYTPTAIGPDGTVFAINNAVLFAVGRGATVAGRNLFYDNSTFDNYTPGPSALDDQAIATDKAAYLPGMGRSTFANVSSYTRGINGLAIDLAGWHGAITTADFIFRMGNNNSVGSWAPAPQPSGFTVRPGAGIGGSDRIELTWPDGAIRNTWLEVQIKGNDARGAFNPNTGLSATDVFYFASAVADSGLGDAIAYSVDATDELAARNSASSLGNPATLSSVTDYNRDGRVNATDQLLARNNATHTATQVVFLQLELAALRSDSTSPADSSMAIDVPCDCAALPGPILKHRRGRTWTFLGLRRPA